MLTGTVIENSGIIKGFSAETTINTTFSGIFASFSDESQKNKKNYCPFIKYY